MNKKLPIEEKEEPQEVDYISMAGKMVKDWFRKRKVTDFKDLLELTNFIMTFNDNESMVHYVNIPELYTAKREEKIRIVKECLNDLKGKNSVNVFVLSTLGRMKVIRKYDKLVQKSFINVINFTAIDLEGFVRRVSLLLPPYNGSYTVGDIMLGDQDWFEIDEEDNGDVLPWVIASSVLSSNLNDALKEVKTKKTKKKTS